MSPRKYDARSRRAGADLTRRRMLEAARSLIGGRGDLSAFSMDAVAEKAGVARMTVYNQFGSRAGLLEALADHLAADGGMARMAEVFREPDPDKALRALAERFVEFWASDRATLRRMRALGVAFPSQDSPPPNRDAWRREAVANLLRRPRGRGPAVPTVSEEAIDVITTLTSFEMFDALCTGRRKPADVARLIGDLSVRIAHPVL